MSRSGERIIRGLEEALEHARTDGAASYDLAIAAKREQRVRAGLTYPLTDAEHEQRLEGTVAVNMLDCVTGKRR